jgi:hypothetical protein
MKTKINYVTKNRDRKAGRCLKASAAQENTDRGAICMQIRHKKKQ